MEFPGILKYLGIIRWVILDDPVHLGDIQPSGSYVSTQQNARVGVAELEEGCGSFGLLLLSLREEKKRFTAAVSADKSEKGGGRLTWMAMTGRSM